MPSTTPTDHPFPEKHVIGGILLILGGIFNSAVIGVFVFQPEIASITVTTQSTLIRFLVSLVLVIGGITAIRAEYIYWTLGAAITGIFLISTLPFAVIGLILIFLNKDIFE